jgi:hypothetical protein
MKGRPAVEWKRCGGKTIWMLFPDPQGPQPGRPWFLVDHDEFFQWVKTRHGTAQGWIDAWSYPRMSADLRQWLERFKLQPEPTHESDTE